MKPKNKSLQKFTDIQVKFNSLMALNKILPKDLEILNKDETRQFYSLLTEKAQALKGIESEKFWNKVDAVINQTTKNQLWEINHTNITCAIATLIQEYGRMPVATEIATTTNLSRQTVHKHLKEYSNHPLFLEQMAVTQFMTSKVLAKVFHFAVNGDMQAAKLYLNAMGVFNQTQSNKGLTVVAEFGSSQNNTLIQKQNNFIQINNTVLSEDIINQLNPDQLKQIEEIVKGCGLNAG
ncbi:MAG: hypothetical protein HYX39_07300 [Bacteroidetes bacterium]|nr:hypothetical protein [Bacteroidota bacterium]